jgi:hypothetical protein
VGDVGAKGSKQAVLAGRGKHDQEIRGPNPVIGFRAYKPAQETKTGRRVRVVMADVAESAIGRGEADRAMALAIKKMEHSGGENDDKNDDHGLFHCGEIIPRPAHKNKGMEGLAPARNFKYLILWM